MPIAKQWFLYLIKCSDESLYTGITVDIERRITEHNSKNGAKALKGKLPVHLVYSEVHVNRSSASKRESEIKQFSRKQKLALIQKNNTVK